VAHRYQAGMCRAPRCSRTVRSNAYSPFCSSCTALDIRYGDPRQRRITQKALTKPLAAVARIRKRNPNADWHLMAENWNILVRRCQEISASKDADSLYRRKAAHVIVQIAESLSADEVVNVIAACYIIEDQNPYFFATDRAFWCCMLHCLRRTGKSGRVFHVGGRDCRSHASYRVLHKRTRDIACDFIVEHMATVGGFIARAEVKHQEAQPDSTTLLSSSVSPLADACRALVRGEAPLVVTILEPKVSGGYAPGATGEIGGYGYKAIGPNAGV
jgi:hypothetical protein